MISLSTLNWLHTGFSQALVHRLVGQPVGFFVFVAENVLDLEKVQSGDAPLGFFVERTQVGAFDLVLAFDLFHHQLRIGDDFQPGVLIPQCEFECGEQSGIFSEVISSYTQKLAQFGDFCALFVLDIDAEASRAGISTRSSIAESGNGALLGPGFDWPQKAVG